MTPFLLGLLCDPATREPLRLVEAKYDDNDQIESGFLVASNGSRYPIIRGIPRFLPDEATQMSVESFGNEWNHFNFLQFRDHWLGHTVANTWGSTHVFADKVIVDAGGGSGAQSLWLMEAGAAHVITLELSHVVDGVLGENLRTSGRTNYDIVQCSIDQPPLRPRSIELVICQNVIQHTPSVEATAEALFGLVAPGGEFAFNCYPRNDQGVFRWFRFHAIYTPLRRFLSARSFRVVLLYARVTALLRLVPVVGSLLEKLGLTMQGDVPRQSGLLPHLQARYRAAVLNTFDWYGPHGFQHHKTDEEIMQLVRKLQPDQNRVSNIETYFRRPPPIGCLLRVGR